MLSDRKYYSGIMKTFTLVITIFLLCCGCAQQRSGSPQTITEEVVLLEAGEEELLSDDFDDFDDFDGEEDGEVSYYDPLEPMNRVFFAFNDKLYYWVLKPANNVYSAILPYDIRLSLGNFVSNVRSPIRLLNNLLQGKISDAGIVLSRFVINSTLGVFGLADPALREFGLEPKPEDFGQTLGVWGLGEGIYFCWPVIGPSNVRDSIGFAGDVYAHPMVYYVEDYSVSLGYYAGSRVNLLSLNPEVYEDLKKYSLDPYISMRQVYLDYRRHKVEDNVTTVQKNDNEL